MDGAVFFSLLGWCAVAWLGTGMWMVLTGRAGFEVEMEEEGDECPVLVRLMLDGLAVLMSPWWKLREHVTGEPWD